MSPGCELEFLLLIRHDKQDQQHGMAEVARALRNLLRELPEVWNIRLGAIEHADSSEAKRTAERLSAAGGPPIRAADEPLDLGPSRFGSFTEPTKAKELLCGTQLEIGRKLAALSKCGKNAVVIVGHQPAIDWFLDEHARTRTPVPLSYGEVACLCRERRAEVDDRQVATNACETLARVGDRSWHLWWVLTPDGAPAIKDIREKISSKMTVVSVLAGFSAAIVAQILTQLPENAPGRGIAVGAAAIFGVVAVLLIGALLAYDQLMMPTRFWQSTLPKRWRASRKPSTPLNGAVVRRPPSSAAWVLFQHSVLIWRWVTGALVLALVGTLVLGLGTACPQSTLDRVLLAVAGIILLAVTAGWWRWGMPNLGAED